MAETIATQSATIKRIVHDPSRNRAILISAAGVDVYRVTDWTRIAWAAIASATCGAINDNGIYVGTSASGVYRLPHAATGAATSQLISVFGTGTAVELASYNISDIAGHGTALAIITASEFVYLPSPATSYDGPTNATTVAMNGTYLAWADSDSVEILNAHPSADFTVGDTSISDTANHLTFEDGTNNLLICHEDGLRLVDCAAPGDAGGGLPTDGLVAHWTFDAVSGTTVYDETGNVNGTLVGGATAGSQAGQIGKALGCDGTDDGMSFGNLGIFGGDFTAVAWVEFDQVYTALSDSESLFSLSGEYSISLVRDQTTGKLRALAYDGSVFDVYSTTIPTPGTLYHVALRWYMGAKFEIIVNAAIEGTNTTARTANADVKTNSIGYRAETTPDRFFDGYMDEVRIYNRVLTDAEIATLKGQADPVVPRAGLVSHYTMDAISGTTLYDETGTANGSISGATQVDGYIGKALSFDGTNDYVEGDDAGWPGGTAARSISLWFKMSDATFNTLFTYGTDSAANRFTLAVQITGNVGVTINGANIFYTSNAQDGNWHHLVVSAPASGTLNDLDFYLDGTLLTAVDSSANPTTAYNTTLDIFRMGRNLAGSGYDAYTLDEVRVYNRALSAQEVAGLFAEAFNPMPRAGLVSHWTMDSINGTALIDETGNNDGTISGATQVDGYIGKALSFDGSNDFVEIAHNSTLKPTAAITYSVWAYQADWSSALGNIRAISCTESGGWNIEFDNTTAGKVEGVVQINGSYQQPGWTYTSLAAGWHLFTVTCDGRYTKLYVDGDLKDTTDYGSASSISYSNNNSIVLGGEAGAGTGCNSNYWDGKIDSVRIYNRYLSAEEIAILYAEGQGGYGTNYDDDLGTVTDCQDAIKRGDYIAYGTSDDADGGRFGIMEIDAEGTATSKTTVAGTDTDAVWLAENATEAIYNNQLEQYRLVAELSPGAGGRSVRRDWVLYAEITDSLGGIQNGTVTLKVNGASQTPTTAAITNGYSVAYTPGSSSGYGERVTIEIGGTDADGNAVSRIWTFTTVATADNTASSEPPPNLTCLRDIGLTADEADETKNGIPIVWIEDITGPLIVAEAQASAIGKVAIDQASTHEHKRTVAVEPEDGNGDPTMALQKGDVITLTCPALEMTDKKCELLAKRRTVSQTAEPAIKYELDIAYYEEA